MATPPHTPPPHPPDTMGRWSRRLRPLVYVVVILFILIMVAMALGQFAWILVLFGIIFIIACIGIVWSRTHPEEDYAETFFLNGLKVQVGHVLGLWTRVRKALMAGFR